MLRNHIHQITLPTPFPVGDVHVYLISDETNVLIDCGCKTEDSYERLQTGLKRLGFSLDDIDQLWLTHAHPDHSGLAARLQKKHNIKVGIHQTELRYMHKNQFVDRFGEWFRKHQVPEYLIQAMDGGRVWYQSYYDDLKPDFLINNGQTLNTGTYSFTAIHLPGHAPGHLAFFGEQTILSGDVLLDRISSNAILTFEHDTTRRVRALCQQRESLEYLQNQTGRVYPGHGTIFDNPADIATLHLNAQENRYQQVIRALEKGSASLFEITKRVFPQAEQPGMTFLCLSEVIGYLDLSIDRRHATFDNEQNIFSLIK